VKNTPSPLAGCRESLLYELALEFAFEQPYQALLAEARRMGTCDEVDLLRLGRRLYLDLARLARGEISGISIPARLPRPGEYAPEVPAAPEREGTPRRCDPAVTDGHAPRPFRS
jgi:hypothetical protein